MKISQLVIGHYRSANQPQTLNHTLYAIGENGSAFRFFGSTGEWVAIPDLPDPKQGATGRLKLKRDKDSVQQPKPRRDPVASKQDGVLVDLGDGIWRNAAEVAGMDDETCV